MRPKFIIFFCLVFYLSSFTSHVNEPIKIALISVDGKELPEAKKIKKYLKSYYHCEVVILPPISLPQEYKSQSDTLKASKVLAYFDILFQQPIHDKYMALTEFPIALNDYFPYIRGLGRHEGSSCIVSVHKIKKEANGNKQLFKRLLKVVSRHEIGHTLGLRHCTQQQAKCMMVSGVYDSVIYEARPVLCDSCSVPLKRFLR